VERREHLTRSRRAAARITSAKSAPATAAQAARRSEESGVRRAAGAERIAQLFKAMADPHRVRIMNILAGRSGAACVCELTGELELSQPTVSHHLKKLVGAGLLHRTQRGTWAYYSLNQEGLRRLAAAAADIYGDARRHEIQPTSVLPSPS